VLRRLIPTGRDGQQPIGNGNGKEQQAEAVCRRPAAASPVLTTGEQEKSMFGMFEGLVKAAVGVATLPVDIVADVVTLGGSLTDRDKPYIATKASDIMDNLANATKGDGGTVI
jgi:hypothetical protein